VLCRSTLYGMKTLLLAFVACACLVPDRPQLLARPARSARFATPAPPRPPASRPGPKPDLLLLNGKFFTADPAQPYVEAVAIAGNRIVATGTSVALRKLATSHTNVLDVQGKTGVPGFNDAHDHLGVVETANTFKAPFSVPGLSKQALADSVQRLVRRARPGQWLSGPVGLIVLRDPSAGRGWLDSLAPQNPVVLGVPWGHGMVVNSQALHALHLADTAPDPLGGWYARQPGTTELAGPLFEYAQFPFWQAVATANPPALVRALQAYAQQQLTFGITTVQNMSSLLSGGAAHRYFDQAALPVRTRVIAMPSTTDRGRNLPEWALPVKAGQSLTYFSGVKYMVDGTSLEQNALRTTPYPGRPGWYGRLNFPPDTLRRVLREALTSNRQLLLHVTGDSATKLVLQMMKQLAHADAWQRKRVRIEHGTGITADAAQDVKQLGIIIVHTPQYGLKSPLRSWLALGIPVALGPDGVTNPFLSIQLVTTGQTTPGENLSREQAVRAYTVGSAYAEFAEDTKGTLQVGKLADLAVLSDDLFSVPAAQLPAIRSVLTSTAKLCISNGALSGRNAVEPTFPDRT
jgi:predicted amidohydrolase YtcJ